MAKNKDKIKTDAKFFWNKPFALKMRTSKITNIFASIFIPLLMIVLMEWVARGNFGPTKQGNGFFESLSKNFLSFALAYIFIVAIYVIISQITGLHALATGVVGLITVLPGIVTFYKLTMRGEPFLPWDLSQIKDLLAVKSSVEFALPKNVILSVIIYVLFIVLAAFIKLPNRKTKKSKWILRLITSGVALTSGLVILFAVFLNKENSEAFKIYEDMWMQDRYYRTHGVVTGFVTNLRMLKIKEPDGYSKKKMLEIEEEVLANNENKKILYNTALTEDKEEFTPEPNIIFLMAEGFWDMQRLPQMEFDQPLMQNFDRLKQEAAYGFGLSPSYGGGTCDVEFEALTGFSIDYLPAGSKPYQQYVTKETPSLPWVLKERGYDTLAIHGYGRKFWNREVAYPRLGIDEFIAEDDFINPHRRRGFISDNAMVDRIIEEFENREGSPVFMHAITMQNHTTYGAGRYPENELVKVTKAPAKFNKEMIDQIEDCATGMREMDAAFGKLTNYLQNQERPTIVVFWGDHLNPMSNKQFDIFTDTGFVSDEEESQIKLQQVPLMIWSNYAGKELDLGTVSTYNISSVMMELFGLEKPMYNRFLTQQLHSVNGHYQGMLSYKDGTFGIDETQEQQEAIAKHELFQYDVLFGKNYLSPK